MRSGYVDFTSSLLHALGVVQDIEIVLGCMEIDNIDLFHVLGILLQEN